jgi:hypothetical protein
MTTSNAAEEHPIFIVSGGVGTSGEQIVRTVLTQFPAARGILPAHGGDCLRGGA